MKKIFSMILACAMIMSLFCAVPVSAEATFGTYELPYIYENFESGETLFASSTNGHNSEVVDSGNANRGKVAQITVTGKTNAGAGMLILLRNKSKFKENLKILGIMYVCSVVPGIILHLAF